MHDRDYLTRFPLPIENPEVQGARGTHELVTWTSIGGSSRGSVNRGRHISNVLTQNLAKSKVELKFFYN